MGGIPTNWRAEVVRPVVAEVVKPVEVVRPSVTEAVRPPVAEVVEPEVVEPEAFAVAEPDVEVQAPTAPAFVAPPAAPLVAEEPAVQEYQSVKLVPEPAPVVSAAPTVVAPEPAAQAPVKLAPALQLEPIQATASLAVAGTATNGHVAVAASAPVIVTPTEAPTPVAAIQEAEPVSAPVAAAPVSAPAPEWVVPAEPAVIPAAPVQTPAAPAQAPPVWAKPQAQPSGNRPHFFAQATKSPSPAEAPAPAVAAAPSRPAGARGPPTKTALGDDRPELESLSFREGRDLASGWVPEPARRDQSGGFCITEMEGQTPVPVRGRRLRHSCSSTTTRVPAVLASAFASNSCRSHPRRRGERSGSWATAPSTLVSDIKMPGLSGPTCSAR
jgi:hypothetical protein